MSEASKIEVSATGFAPHIEELHEFFRSRGVGFGTAADLAPFVERLSTDLSFRDEMASMVRAIIYRERDGLTPVELMELLVTAAAGSPAEDAPADAREAVRRLMGFTAGVFRSRWNPGETTVAVEPAASGSVPVAAKPIVAEPVAGAAAVKGTAEPKAAEAAAAQPTARPMSPIFYRAQVVANGGEEAEDVLPVREPVEESREARARVELDAAPSVVDEAAATPVAAFVRGDVLNVPPPDSGKNRSFAWVWGIGIFAVLLAFCAGLFVRQWMMMRAVGMVHVGPVPTGGANASAANTGTAHPPNGGEVNVPTEPKAERARRAARVEAARSEWRGGAESGVEVPQPASKPPAGGAMAAAAGSTGAVEAQPSAGQAKPTPEVRANVGTAMPRRPPGIVGVSPGLMGSHLVYAPPPEYPELARLAHVQGRVVVQAEVDRDGYVVWARAISGHRLLRGAAESSVYERQYRPYLVNDRPTTVQTLVTVNFQLP